MFPVISLSAMEIANLGALFSSKTSTLLCSSMTNCYNLASSMILLPKRRYGFVISASTETNNNNNNVEFEPFEEVKKEAFMVPVASQVSIARQSFSDACEAAINEQIKVAYEVSYEYHAMYAYFDRDNIAYEGLAKFFKESSEEQREQAETLMKYQNIRGGKVKLHSIVNPPSEFDKAELGDALYAMEVALSLEKLTNEKLLNLHSLANQHDDPQLAEFIETEFLAKQVETIKKIADYVTQLWRVGKGHGFWNFDQSLLEG